MNDDIPFEVIGDLSSISERKVDSNEITPYLIDENNEHLQIKNDLNAALVIFINPFSGNKQGELILKITSNYKTKKNYKLIDFSKINKNILENKYEFFTCIFFDLTNEEDLNKGINCIKEYINSITKGELVKILIGGGNGSVISIIRTLQNNNINTDKCIFGHIPLGKENNLSKTLGFNDHIKLSNNVNSLYKILLKYHKAMSAKVDVWKMELKLDENEGEIIENLKEGKKVNKMNCFNKTFINYLSLGYDARIGFNYDKKRTSNSFCNKIIYCWEGIKKNCCRKSLKINGFIESFSVYEDEDQSFIEKTFISNMESEDNLKIKFKFKPKNELTNLENEEKCYILKGEPITLICQNINYYIEGVNNIWNSSNNKLAFDVIESDKNKKENYLNKVKKMIKAKQKIDDKKLEFFTYDNGFESGIDKIIGGMANKLYHGCGPVLIKFKDITPLNDKKDRIYLNVDGDYYNIVKPISLKIQLDKSICNGQIPFLVNISYEVKKK